MQCNVLCFSRNDSVPCSGQLATNVCCVVLCCVCVVCAPRSTLEGEVRFDPQVLLEELYRCVLLWG